MCARRVASSGTFALVACHEGNAHTMSGILGAARADEKAAEEAATRKPK